MTKVDVTFTASFAEPPWPAEIDAGETVTKVDVTFTAFIMKTAH